MYSFTFSENINGSKKKIIGRWTTDKRKAIKIKPEKKRVKDKTKLARGRLKLFMQSFINNIGIIKVVHLILIWIKMY